MQRNERYETSTTFYIVCTLQPVLQPAVKPVVQPVVPTVVRPAVKCKRRVTMRAEHVRGSDDHAGCVRWTHFTSRLRRLSYQRENRRLSRHQL